MINRAIIRAASIISMFCIFAPASHAWEGERQRQYKDYPFPIRLDCERFPWLKSCQLPDLIVGIISACHYYRHDYNNQNWKVSVGVKNIGGNKGITMGEEMPLYVNLNRYLRRYQWDSSINDWNLSTQVVSKTDVHTVDVPMAGRTSNIQFEYNMRDTGPAGANSFLQNIPKVINILADHTWNALPGWLEESNEINNFGSVSISYLNESTNEIETGYPKQFCWWFYHPDFYN